MSKTDSTKAWTFTHGGFPSALHLSTIPLDNTPLPPHSLLIAIKAAALNPVDAQLMSYPLLPYIPSFLLPTHKGVGEDFSGVVLEAGSATGFKAGDEVFGIGPFLPGGTVREVMRLDVRKGVVLPKPKEWTWKEASSLPLVWITAQTLITSVEGWMQVSGRKGMLVVLGGSSSCGMYVIHIAKQRGWHVAATCSARNSKFVKSMGAIETIDYTSPSISVPDEIKKFAPDAIIDCVGGTECLYLAPRYVTVVGDKTDRLSMGGALIYLTNPQMAWRTVRGWLGMGESYACVNLDFRREFLERSVGLGRDQMRVDSVWGFGDVREAFERMNSGKGTGKVVVKVAE